MHLLDAAGQETIPQNIVNDVMSALRKHFRPEFLNRLDDIILFKPLKQNDLRGICRNMMKLLDERLKDRDINVVVHDSASDVILKMAYDPAYGARPLRRYIEKNITTEVSKLLVAGKLKEHSDLHIEGTANDELQYRSEPKAKRRKLATDVSDDDLMAFSGLRRQDSSSSNL